MSFSVDSVLQNDEKAIYNLRELYKKHGYSHYKVSKFEEYDLYVHNKSFLISENILSFTDTDGKLMALKPDVTLSIVKNIALDESDIHKLYYNEYVYRTSAENNGFKEIMQTGLECIGNVDTFSECEVVMLAMKSLAGISEDYLLDISHMGLVEGMLELAGVASECTQSFLKLVGAKNIPGLKTFLNENGADSKLSEKICELAGMYLPIKEALPKIGEIALNEKIKKAYDELSKICDAIDVYGLSDKLYADISVINDMNYYDGVIFNGFIKDIPDSVLSGGRYDRLLSKLGKSVGAIGFAVYLDKLEHFGADDVKYDVDVLLTYDESTPYSDIIDYVNKLISEGNMVRTSLCADTTNIRYKQLLKVEREAKGN